LSYFPKIKTTMEGFPENVCVSASSNSVTREYWSLEGERATHAIVLAVYLLLLFCELLGLPWNILVIVAIAKEKLYHQPNIILLVNLIVADFFILLVPTPLLMTLGFAGEFIIGHSDEARCQYCSLGFLLVTPITNYIITVAMMSLDRFFYIYSPFKYEMSSTKYVALVGVMASIVLSIALGCVVLFMPGTAQFDQLLFFCVKNYYLSAFVPYLIIVVFVSVLVVIVVSNACFSWIVLKNIRAVYSTEDYSNEGRTENRSCRLRKRVASTRHQKQKRLCCMQFFLLWSSFFTLVPSLILLCSLQIMPENLTIEVVTVVLILLYSQVYIHPIIETSLIYEIRVPLRDMLTCGYFKKKNKDSFSDDQGKLSKGFKRCLEEGGKFSFFITALEAAIIPRDIPSSNSGEKQRSSLKEVL